MKIPIAGYVLTSEAKNIILNKVNTYLDGEKEGEEYLNPVGYFSTIDQAMKGLVNRKIRESEATTLKQLLKEVREIRKMIETALEGV